MSFKATSGQTTYVLLRIFPLLHHIGHYYTIPRSFSFLSSYRPRTFVQFGEHSNIFESFNDIKFFTYSLSPSHFSPQRHKGHKRHKGRKGHKNQEFRSQKSGFRMKTPELSHFRTIELPHFPFLLFSQARCLCYI